MRWEWSLSTRIKYVTFELQIAGPFPNPIRFLTILSLSAGILEVVPAIGAWIQNLCYKEKIPTFDWTIDKATGEIVATLDDNSVVHSATMWYSYSCGVNNWDNGE